MSDLEVLQSVLKFAVDKGWRPTQYEAADIPFIERTWRNIILTPEFAQYLWGNGEPEYHLQQLVISDDPITYLKENT